ncbi:Polyketide synthase enoylreductase [Penicillium cosmopolitanum]|uniref:D-xylulose reductase n=1 Tax=Penicillium cosmopolitanum TaxID=1131564 RepID=A0A9W9SCW5_9EURO|nr:Polyketide synthase enoylreductase [Penicillium cosmopolitanum]KAJ5376351.1 Polyketide synthase enoylreductase [Penicillium cosmopolitanum]
MTSAATAKNLSFVLEGIHQVKFEDRPIPELKKPHDVIINVRYTGICGSDPEGRRPSRNGTRNRLPTLRTLQIRQIQSLRKHGFRSNAPYDGTLAKYYTLPEDFCYKLPEALSLQEGALMEPLSVAVHIVRQASVSPGQSVVVFGAGPVGLLCCAVATAFGASTVIAVDIQQSRLDFAKNYATTSTFMPGKVSAIENAERMKKENNLGAGADVAIDASGAEPSVHTGIHVLRNGGTYVQGGMGRSEIQFPIMAACSKELTLKGSFRYGSGDYKLAVGLVASGKVDVKKLITGTVKFEEAEQAFKEVKAGKGIKTLIAGIAE